MTDTMNEVSGGMNGTLKAVSQDELGGPDVLKLVTLPIPEPGISEILIRVCAAGGSVAHRNCPARRGRHWMSMA